MECTNATCSAEQRHSANGHTGAGEELVPGPRQHTLRWWAADTCRLELNADVLALRTGRSGRRWPDGPQEKFSSMSRYKFDDLA